MTVARGCTAAWSAPRILEALSRKGWGDLDGRAHGGLRKVLYALVALLPHEAAQGKLTASQVAIAAGQSEKWTRHCLTELDARGLIVWRRGWLENGRPRPGWIRLCKDALSAMVRGLRDALDDKLAKHRAATRERITKTLHCHTQYPWRRRNPLSVRPELTSTLPAPTGSTARGGGTPDTLPTLPGMSGDTMTDCQVCGRPEHQCRMADAKLPLRQQHQFTPRRASHRQLVAPAHRRAPAQTQAPRGWRASIRAAMHPAPSLLDERDDQ
jgi:hypothetical protein